MTTNDEATSERPPRGSPDGWEAAFAEMAALHDDALLDEDAVPSSFDDHEWEWRSCSP